MTTKTVELRRHTASDGDVLTAEGIVAAVAIGEKLKSDYGLLVSSGAQRATQTLACFLAGLGRRQSCGVIVDDRFRSAQEQRWIDAAKRGGGGPLTNFIETDPGLVAEEAKTMGEALASVFDRLPDGGRALVVGHSPMHETAIYGLTGTIVEPISKGAGLLVVREDEAYRIEPASASR
jgi:broad specificity phosphatase PhoE